MTLLLSRHGRCSVSMGGTGTAKFSLLLALTFVSSVPTVFSASPAHCAPVAKAQESYVRELRGADGHQEALQTEIRRFDPVKGSGPSVYLVAATHIGEKSYYGQLQRFLDKQDIVLCEGVRRSRIPAKIQSGPVSARVAPRSVGVQKRLADALDLQFQLDGINYNRPKFRNSDMDWDSMKVLAKKAGVGAEKELAELNASLSSGLNTGLSGRMLNFLLAQSASHPALSNLLRGAAITALSDPNLAEKSVTPNSDKLYSIIVVERNHVVLADLKALLKTSKKAPKPLHSIALFYGAEHMKGIGQQLISVLGFRATDTQWLTAIRAAH